MGLFQESLGQKAGPVSPLDLAQGGMRNGVSGFQHRGDPNSAQEDTEEGRRAPLWLKVLSWVGKAEGHRDWRSRLGGDRVTFPPGDPGL